MKTQLLKKKINYIPIIVLMFFFSIAHAQIVYTDVVDHAFTCGGGGIAGCYNYDSLDVNNDGLPDFVITYQSHTLGCPFNCAWISRSVSVTALNGNAISID